MQSSCESNDKLLCCIASVFCFITCLDKKNEVSYVRQILGDVRCKQKKRERKLVAKRVDSLTTTTYQNIPR